MLLMLEMNTVEVRMHLNAADQVETSVGPVKKI